jgi:hypothetical protein
MDTSTQIAGSLTIGDWLHLKESIERSPERTVLWEKAYVFFEKRISTRYLKPIEAIEHNSNIEGEGFAIVAIICSLIEALETFRQGKVYKRASKARPLDEEKEYFKSQPIFESFLKNRDPFKSHFAASDLAADFYENVRCAILHEAATRNRWKIRINTGVLVEKRNESVILNRVLFVDAIKQYMEHYKTELLASSALRKAYIQKMNSICETA